MPAAPPRPGASATGHGRVLLPDRQLSVLIVATQWWPLSARLASALVRHGCRVATLSPAGHPVVHVAGIAPRFHYGGFDAVLRLQDVLERAAPDVVIPCDDAAAAQLHGLHATSTSLRGLIERSLGSPASYAVVDSRHELLAAAQALGIAVPANARVRDPEDLATWHRASRSAAVLKADLTNGGNGVRISHSLDASIRAWRELKRHIGLPVALKRLVIDRDPVAIWAWRGQDQRGITIQEFVSGRPANSMVACHQGTVLAIVSVAVVVSQGATGAANVVRTIENPEMTRAAELLAAHLGLTGFYGLDFMLDAGSGRAWLVELNPRCTQLGHLELPGQGSLAGAYCAALNGHPRPAPHQPIDADTIAIFPQAGVAPTSGAAAGAIHHDVPWDEPALVAELMRADPWPHRRLLSRLYHAVRPLQRSPPVAYEAISRFGLETS